MRDKLLNRSISVEIFGSIDIDPEQLLENIKVRWQSVTTVSM